MTTLVYTCPSGFRAILRDWALVNVSATAGPGRLALMLTPAGSSARYVFLDDATEALVTYERHGTDVVLDPGDRLSVVSWTVTDYVLSGAEVVLTG